MYGDLANHDTRLELSPNTVQNGMPTESIDDFSFSMWIAICCTVIY